MDNTEHIIQELKSEKWEMAQEIDRLREALKECAKPFSGKALDYESAAYKLMNELERRIQISKYALQQKETE